LIDVPGENVIRDVQRFSALVGRRTALRCAVLGLAAVTLEACGSSSKKKKKKKSSSDGGQGSTTAPTASPSMTSAAASAMLGAFVKGRWRVTANGGSCVVTVGDGTWRVSDGVAATTGPSRGFLTRKLHGTFALQGGKMEVAVLEGDGDTTPKNGLVSNLPAEVRNPADILAAWNYERDQFETSFKWDGKQVVLFFSHRTGGYIKFVAERA
jgi:hypothetical protein